MRHLWQAWVPRVEDYWASFSAPYRTRVTELIDKHTPVNGAVMDFGCGAGVQTFLLRQRRPDILIYSVDCNAQARNFTRVLCGTDERVILRDTPITVDDMPDLDTLVSVFASSYLDPNEVGTFLSAFHEKARTLILCEPSNLDGSLEVRAFSGMPTTCFFYPYAPWLQDLGRAVETVVLDPTATLNAIHIATHAGA